jgi:hypothetical protein
MLSLMPYIMKPLHFLIEGINLRTHHLAQLHESSLLLINQAFSRQLLSTVLPFCLRLGSCKLVVLEAGEISVCVGLACLSGLGPSRSLPWLSLMVGSPAGL